MSDFPTHGDLVQVAVDSLAASPGTRLTEEAALRDGSDLNVILNVAAGMADEVARKASEVCRGLLLDSAEGEALDRLAFDLPFPISRNAASPALVPVTLVRPSNVKGAGTLPAGAVVTLAGGKFELVSAVPVGALALTVNAFARSQRTGPEGNVPLGSIGAVVTAAWDTTWVVTATQAGAGGSDAETDVEFRARIRAAHETARRGTVKAIETGALSVAGVTHAAGYEMRNGDGTLAQAVQLIISDDAGYSNAALEAAVLAVIDEYRPAGIPVYILSGSPVQVPIVLAVAFDAGADTLARFDDAAARVVAAANALGPGQTLYRNAIASAVLGSGIVSTGIVSVTVVAPVGDVVPDATEVLRASRALVTPQ